MTKRNLMFNTIAILEVIDELRKVRSIKIEEVGAEKLQLEQACLERLAALMNSYPFEEVLELVGDKQGAA